MKLLLGCSGTSIEATALSANHKEAETRLILNANDAIQNNYKLVIVICRMCYLCTTLVVQKLTYR